MAGAQRRVIAADTNVALRLLLQDDESQLAAIEAAMAEQRLFFSLTVIQETGWVLASRYQLSRGAIADSMLALATLDTVEFARGDLVRWAIERFRQGADWADMIHLVAARKVGAFLTLDRKVQRHAGEGSPVQVETLR